MNELVRRRVSRNPSTPPDALASLAGDADGDAEVRWHVARNPSVSPGTRERLLREEAVLEVLRI